MTSLLSQTVARISLCLFLLRGSSTKLTLDFARLSLISLREGHYFKRISARVSPNAIQCLNIAGWSWKVSITWLTAPPVFLTSKRPIESGIRLHRITLALIWWSPTNRGSGRSRQNRASMAFLLPAWTSTQSLGKLNSQWVKDISRCFWRSILAMTWWSKLIWDC